METVTHHPRTRPPNWLDPKWADFSVMKSLTCENHTGSRYLWKGPGRGLHIIDFDPRLGTECPCPFSDMVEIVTTDDGDCDHNGVFATDGFDRWCGRCQSYVPHEDL
jgi:hypothetical protein